MRRRPFGAGAELSRSRAQYDGRKNENADHEDLLGGDQAEFLVAALPSGSMLHRDVP